MNRRSATYRGLIAAARIAAVWRRNRFAVE